VKIRRILLWLFLLTVAATAIGCVYLYTIYLPKRLYEIARQSLSQVTARKVSLGQAEVKFSKGVVLKDIIIFEEDGKTEFLRVQELNCQLLLLPSLKEKRVVIPAINIIGPSVSIARRKDGSWNFAQLEFLKNLRLRAQRISFFVYSVNFDNAAISFRDEFVTPRFERTIKDLSGSLSLGLPSNLKFRCSFAIDGSAAKAGLRGGYNFASKMFYVNSIANDITVTEFAAYYKNALPFEIHSLTMSPNARFACYADGRSRLAISSDISGLSLSVKDTLANAAGNFKLDLLFNFKKKSKPTYSGEITLDSADISGIPGAGPVTAINAQVKFNQDLLTIEKLQCLLRKNTFEATGSIKDYLTAPFVDLNASYIGVPFLMALKITDYAHPAFALSLETQELDLARIKELSKENIVQLLGDTALDGKCSLRLNIAGNLSPELVYDLNGSVKLVNISIANPNFADKVTGISGVVSFGRDYIQFEKVCALFGGTAYTASGRIENLAQPKVQLAVGSATLNFDSDMTLTKENVRIESCKGRYQGVAFDFGGNISGLKDPRLGLSGVVSFDIKEAMKFFPKYKKALQDSDLSGEAACRFTLDGKAKMPKEWALDIEAQSEKIGIYRYVLKNARMNFKIKAEQINVTQLSADFYDGTISAQGSVNMSEENPPFKLEANLLDAQIAKLKEATPLKDKNIYGSLSAALALDGRMGAPATYSGNGWVRIRDGYLWESPLLGLLAGLAYLPQEARTVFKDAAGNFSIKEERIYTRDLTLLSDEIRLVGDGSLGFDKTLSFDIGLNVSGGLAQRLNLTSIGSFLVAETGDLLMDIKLKGTLGEPKFTKRFNPQKILKEKIFKKLPQIFEDILQ